jgi:hypothetical protein
LRSNSACQRSLAVRSIPAERRTLTQVSLSVELVAGRTAQAPEEAQQGPLLDAEVGDPSVQLGEAPLEDGEVGVSGASRSRRISASGRPALL